MDWLGGHVTCWFVFGSFETILHDSMFVLILPRYDLIKPRLSENNS